MNLAVEDKMKEGKAMVKAAEQMIQPQKMEMPTIMGSDDEMDPDFMDDEASEIMERMKLERMDRSDQTALTKQKDKMMDKIGTLFKTSFCSHSRRRVLRNPRGQVPAQRN